MLLVFVSVGLHLAGLFFMPERALTTQTQRRPVEMEIVHIEPPPPEPEPEPAPPEPEPPVPPPPVRPPPVRKPPAKPPPPRAVPPPPNQEAPQAPEEPPPLLTGLSFEATTEAGSFAAPVGNTSHGAMRGPVANPAEVKPYKGGGGRGTHVAPGEVDVAPVVLSELKPPYPEAARRAGVEGDVRLRLWLDEKGNVERAELQKKVGYGLDEAAQEAIMRFKFKPAMKGGKPVATYIIYNFRFYLD